MINYNINGYWLSLFEDLNNKPTLELIHIKQKDHKIKFNLTQYKPNSCKKFYGDGIIKDKYIMAYYYGLSHIGCFAFKVASDIYQIKADYLSRGFIEDSDLDNKSKKGSFMDDTVLEDMYKPTILNPYKLKKVDISLIDTIKLFLSNNKYDFIYRSYINSFLGK